MRIILGILCLLLSFTGNSQRYSFVKYSTEQGLPQSQVTSVCQDDDGYLWISTLGGLAKFNGGEFTTFSTIDGLLNNRVTTVENFNNTIWIGHDGGITYYRNNKFTKIGFSGNDKSRGVSRIINFNNRIIICSNGGGLYELRKDKLERIEIGEDFQRIRDGINFNGELYLATRNGVLTTTDLKSFKVLEELDSLSFSGIHANDNYLVVSSYTDGIFRKNISTGEWKSIAKDDIGLTLTDCFIDNNDRIWLSSHQGIATYSKEGSTLYYDEDNGLPVNMISCFFQDSDGYMWIGSQGKGIFRFPGLRFEYYDQSTGFPTDLFLGGFQKSNGTYYFATYDKGLIKKTSDGKLYEIPVNRYNIWASLQNFNGSDWFGSEASLIEIRENGKVVEHTVDEGLPGMKITALFKADRNTMYIGGSEGVSVLTNGDFKRIGDQNPDKLGTVRDFEVIDGKLFCVSNLGLFEYKNDDFVHFDGIHEVVYNLEKDESGNLWFGTEEGLYRIKNNKVEHIRLLDDPASNYVTFMNYRDGELYVGTNNGLFVLQSLDLETPVRTRYGIGDGLVELETNLNSGFFDNNGRFWFGTAAGLVCYHPNIVEFKQSRPNINLKRILLNYERFDYSNFASTFDADGLPKDLVLPYSKNNLIFEMDGIALVNHSGLSYQFLLDGLHEEWSPLTDNPTLSFTSLPAGNYVLKMRSVDIDGRKSNVISFPFTIKEAYYRTWWFVTSCIAFVFLLVLLIFRVRLRRIHDKNEKEKLEYKARLVSLEQKSINASMNRHFIFNALNSIQYFINTRDRISANKYLTDFAKLIRKNLDAVNLDGNTISLEDELSRMELYLSLESMRFKDRFEYEINVKDVDTEAVQIPAMLMQPFIENSIIHGILPNEDRKGLIKIDIEIREGYLLINILDNGIGVQESMSKKAVMEGDHKSQGMEITSKRIELIKKLSDFDISLTGPEQVYDENRSINGTHVLIKMKLLDFDF